MTHTVRFTEGASQDLREIAEYLRQEASVDVARRTLAELRSLAASLKTFPHRAQFRKKWSG